ncbi:MAG: hypothetical protein FWG64_01360, partial [Firmicutes bacterium]|nr:hypothetical protein [Bacillota bacterium]
QSRAEQSRAEQSRAEQSRAEQSRAEQSRAEPFCQTEQSFLLKQSSSAFLSNRAEFSSQPKPLRFSAFLSSKTFCQKNLYQLSRLKSAFSSTQKTVDFQRKLIITLLQIENIACVFLFINSLHENYLRSV